MTDAEKQAMLTAMTGESSATVLSTYLTLAASKVCRKAYPYDPTVITVPAQYESLQVEIAAYLLNKRGAEGEKTHSENGISRTYENGDVPNSLMRQITPFIGVLSAESDPEPEPEPTPDPEPEPEPDGEEDGDEP